MSCWIKCIDIIDKIDLYLCNCYDRMQRPYKPDQKYLVIRREIELQIWLDVYAMRFSRECILDV